MKQVAWDPAAPIVRAILRSATAQATPAPVPDTYEAAARAYAAACPADGVPILGALARTPRVFKGGWLLRLQPAASAMTLDDTIFVRGTLGLVTYIHELVHVYQYGTIGSAGFLTSYFAESAAVILGRWLRGQPARVMRSNHFEDEAYELAARFRIWSAAA